VDPDGDALGMNDQNLFGWGYYHGAQDFGDAREGYDYGVGGGNWSNPGGQLVIKPVEPLKLAVYVPIPNGYADEALKVYKKVQVGADYNIGIGNVSLGYNGDLNESVTGPIGADGVLPVTASYSGDGSTLWAGLGLKPLDAVRVAFGVAYTLPVKVETGIKNTYLTYNAPVGLHLGVGFNSGDFDVKFRVRGEFGEKTTAKNTVLGTQVIKAGLLPSFSFGNVTASLDTGVGVSQKLQDQPDNKNKVRKPDAEVSWFVMPYVVLDAGGKFFAGVRFDSNGVKDGSNPPIVNWSIPLGMNFGW